jgi:hypothetical protein
MVKQAFVTSLIKSDGSILPFFERPVSAILATARSLGSPPAGPGDRGCRGRVGPQA